MDGWMGGCVDGWIGDQVYFKQSVGFINSRTINKNMWCSV